MSAPKVPLFPILLVNFIGTMGYSIVLPFIVVLVLQMGGNELSYGFLGATYSLFQFIGSPILGNWSDRYGRRKILLLSEGGTFAGWALFLIALYLPAKQLAIHSGVLKIFANTLPLFLFFIARAVDGVTGGNISVANAYLADISSRQDRKKNFGKMSAAQNIGFIVGPALAGTLGATALGDMLPVMAAMLISLLAIVTIIFGIKDVAPKPDVPAVTGTGKVGKVGLRQVWNLPGVPYFLILYFLIFLGFNFFYVAFPVYAVQQLRWGTLQLGIFFAVLSGVMVVVQGPVLGWLSKRIAGAILVIAGNLFLAVGFALFTSSSTVLLYTGLVFFSVGNGISWPSFMALLSNVTDDKYQGAVQGYAGSAGSLASIAGLIIGAFLYRVVGGNIFYLTTAFMILIALASYKLIAIEKGES